MQNKHTSRIIKSWFPVFVCMGFIFYISSIPGRNIPSLFVFQDIVFHLFVYAILGFFITRAVKNNNFNIATTKAIVFTVIFGVVYGITDELHQAFVPCRSVSGLDVFIDGIGSFLGSLTYQWLK